MNAMICGAVLRGKNVEVCASTAINTQVRIFTEKMQAVYRDIPGLLTSRDTVICRLNIVHGIEANSADRINTPQPEGDAQLTTCKKFGRNISCCRARNQNRRIPLA